VASLIGNDSAYDTVITSGKVALMLNDGEQVGLKNAIPGDSVTKEFSVKNTGTVETTYNAYFSELLNQFEDKNDLVYTLTSENGCSNSNETVVPSEVGEQSKFISNCSIKPNQIHNYQLTITFKNNNTNQDDNKGKKFSTKISINEYKEYEYIGYLTYGSDFKNKMTALAGSLNNITTIQFSEIAPNEEDNFIEVSNTDENYASDCPTYMWYDNGTINIYTKNKKLYLHEHSEAMFSNMPNLLSVDLSKFDTSKVISMNSMFANDSSLTALDVSNFNTSKVEDMTAMFSQMTNLEYLNLLSFDTSNVKSMMSMFFRDTNLKFVNLYSFNTINVTSMESMFNSCNSMERLDLKNFNTSNVTEMERMFNKCYKLKEIKGINNFNTINITNMNSMFNE
jgi:surface protein